MGGGGVGGGGGGGGIGKSCKILCVYIHWSGLLDWNSGLDYWTDIFLVFTCNTVDLIHSYSPRG